MPYTLRVECRPKYLYVAAEGPFTSLAEAVKLWTRTLALCREHARDALLFVREGEFLRDPVDAHMLARSLADMGFAEIRLAFAAPLAEESMLTFVERVALQSGIPGRAFRSVRLAEEWLEAPDLERPKS